MSLRLPAAQASARRAAWWSSIPFPREHGAWGMLLGATVLAWAHPRVWGWPAAVLVLLFFVAFAIQAPLRALVRGRRGSARGWAAAYATVLLAGTVWLVGAHDLYVLLPAAAFGAMLTAGDLALRRWRLHRALAARIAGGGVLTLVLPGTLCIMHPSWAAYAFVLWGLTLGYFVTRLLSVRVRLARNAALADVARTWERAWLGGELVVYAGVTALIAAGLASGWTVLAFVPATLASILTRGGLAARRIGWCEVALLVWFVVALITSFHLGGFHHLVTR